MAHVILKGPARAALRAIVLDRRREVGFMASRALYQRIMTRIYRLRDFPELGRRVPEWVNDDVRELIVPPYRIIYEIEDNTVNILNIVDGRSLLPSNDERDSDS